MVYFNRTGAEFDPVAHGGIDRGLLWHEPDEIRNESGIYFRSRIFEMLSTQVDDCMAGRRPFADLSTDAYQAFVERGWKRQHGSYEAAQRWADKGREEIGELEEAVDDYFDAEHDTEEERAAAEHVVEEAGDNLFIPVAVSSNGGNVSSDSIKSRLYEYAVGTKVASGDGFTEPDWYDAAAQLSIKRGAPTIGDIDDLIRSGFVPRISAAMNLYDEEVFSPHAAVFEMRMHASAAIGCNMQQLGYGDEKDRMLVSGAAYERLAADIGRMTAEAYFRVAALAQYVGHTLADVVAMNVDKVSGRVITRTVDKTDGPRG